MINLWYIMMLLLIIHCTVAKMILQIQLTIIHLAMLMCLLLAGLLTAAVIHSGRPLCGTLWSELEGVESLASL